MKLAKKKQTVVSEEWLKPGVRISNLITILQQKKTRKINNPATYTQKGKSS